jgi:2-dehydropantoate 2-reductase
VRIAVMGAGGVGGYFGGRLAQAGETVAFVARGAHLGAIQTGGLHVRSVEGDFSVTAPATDDPARVPELIGSVDLVLFCVKLYDTEAAAVRLQRLLAPHTAVLSLQNGVAKDSILADALGAERILGGQCHVFVAVERPGVIRHAGGGTLAFGEPDGRTSERATRLLESARKAGLRVELSADIRRVQWEKYLMILGLSAMSAVTRRPMGEIRRCPESRRLYQSVFEEVAAIARAEGVDLGDVVARTMGTGDRLPPDAYSSMYHDVTQGRRLELDWLHGHALRLADRHGIPAPALFALYAALRPVALVAERAA